MISVLAVAVAAFGAIAVAGIGLTLTVDPRASVLRMSTLPIGFATLIVISYPFGLFTDYSSASPIVVGLVALLLACGIGRRWRASKHGDLRRAIETGAIPITVAGLAVAFVLLLPLLKTGFPSTLGITNNDGWGYAGLIDWLQDHRFYYPPEDTAEPLSFIAAGQNAFDFSTGLERLGAVLAWVLGEPGYRVLGPMLAVLGAVAVASFGMLARALGARRGFPLAAAGTLFGLTPLLVLAYADVYASQFIALAITPLVLAAFISVMTLGAWRQAGLAALSLTALVSIYPTALIWTLPAIVAIVAWKGVESARASGSGRPVISALRWPALAVGASLVVGFIQWDSAWRNLLEVSGKIGNSGFPGSHAGKATIQALGAAASNDGLAGTTVTWTLLAMTALVAAAIAAIVVRAISVRPGGLGLLAAMAGTVFVITIGLVINYRAVDPYSYGAFKALIGGMPIIFALILVAGVVTIEARSGDGVATGAIAVIAAIWLPVSIGLLSAQADGTTGFRAADVEMSRAVEDLPPTGQLLLAGTQGEYARRLAAVNLVSLNRPDASEGFGTGPSPLTRGGVEDRWLPRAPWAYSLETHPLPVRNQGPAIWTNGAFTLRATPAISITPWGANWSTTEPNASAWTSGPVSVLISNRLPSARNVMLSVVAESAVRPRQLRVVGPGNHVLADTKILPATRTRVNARFTSPPGVTKVDLDPLPATPVRIGSDPRDLVMKIWDVRVRPTMP